MSILHLNHVRIIDFIYKAGLFINENILLSIVGISGGNWIEIAYGTESGVVRIIVQHPETVYAAGHGPQLFQTFTVHRSPVIKVMLSEKHLISGNVPVVHGTLSVCGR